VRDAMKWQLPQLLGWGPSLPFPTAPAAVFPGVEGNQTREESRNMTISTGGQRKLIPDLSYSLKRCSKDDEGMAHSIYCMKGE
jgi:hypothetical protein